MVELQQEMGIQVSLSHVGPTLLVSIMSLVFNTIGRFLKHFAQVSNQQQHRQQPRNGVQQLLQAQQVSFSKYWQQFQAEISSRANVDVTYDS